MKKWGQAELRDFIDPEEAGDKEVGGRLGDRRDVPRANHSKIGPSFASTSSRIASGAFSSFLPPRAPRSSARG